MVAVYRDMFAKHLRQWAADFGFDVPAMAFVLLKGLVPGVWSLSLNASLELPPELDSFMDEQVLGFLAEMAAS